MTFRNCLMGGIVLTTIVGILIATCQLLQANNEQNGIKKIPTQPITAIDSTLVSPPNRMPSGTILTKKDSLPFLVGEYGDSMRLEVLNATFLHNTSRNYYGDSAPAKLDIIWKHKLGSGYTRIGRDSFKWRGAGWTGQPLLVRENGKLCLIQGAYDHHLKKIDAITGKLIWQYKFDDVIKGTGSIWLNPKADSIQDFCLIMQGSRAGTSLYSKRVPSYRAVSYFSGKEVWVMNSTRTRSYSRDVDASCLVVNDTAYIGLENGIFTVFNPNPKQAALRNKLWQPQLFKNTDTLYTRKDRKKHGGNLVTEASPVLLGNHIYISSGSGHVWGYNLQTKRIDWDFFIGSDLDGTPTITPDSCLLVPVEKQYIKGRGGLLKLNPRKTPKEAVVWYYPTDSVGFDDWEGGVIGSASTNYSYKEEGDKNIAAFVGIDGYLYLIDTDRTAGKTRLFDNKTKVSKPKLLAKYKVGSSISTPIMVDNKIIVTSYRRTYLLEYDSNFKLKQLDKVRIKCEATPVVHAGKVYLASRDGYLYCLGQKKSKKSLH